MFFCEKCRVERDWPKSLGWPFMGVSYGRCEMCSRTTDCHDVPSSGLPPIPSVPDRVRIVCGECGESRLAEKGDYLCTFCRGTNKIEE